MRRKIIASILSAFVIAGTASILTSCDDIGVVVQTEEKTEYIINFYSDGGSDVPNQKIEKNSKITKPSDPVKSGFIFAGWYQDGARQVEWNFDSDIVTANMTLYAKWVFEEIAVVRFNSKGGTVVSGQSIKIGSLITKPTDPTRSGYVFAGWYQDEECTQAWSFDSDMVSDNMTLYAKWTATGETPQPQPGEKYKVTFDAKGGSTVKAIENVESGAKISKPSDPTRGGYRFGGWYKSDPETNNNAVAWSFDNDTVSGNITLYAKWTATGETPQPQPGEKYKVTFDAKGGSTVKAIENVESGTKISKPSDPTRGGYVFDGWYKSDPETNSNAEAWLFATDQVTKNVTLYAKWVPETTNPTEDTVTIYFDSNGGNSIATRKVDKNTPVSQPLDPERPGYEFKGWYQANGQKWNFNANVTANMTLTAKWDELSYTISFENNGHGGSGVSDLTNQSFMPDQLPTLSDSTLLFAGWCVDAKLEELAVSGTKLTQNMTLYAKWITKDDINVTEAKGHLETAYLEWQKQNSIKDYNVYYKKKDALDSTYVKIDKPLIREYEDYYRADVLGLAAGDYTLKVESIANNSVGASATRNVTVSAHERSGFGFSKHTASGAYNDDGTLRDDAKVIYVTKDNAKTVTCDIDGTTFTGIQDILTGKQKGSTVPLAIRMIGLIKVDDLDSCGSSSEGLQVKGKNAFAEMNITIEGVGEDTTISGFGFLIRNCKNVEVRNFGIMSQMDDGISIDTDNSNIWVHNLDIYYGKKGSGDKAKGDGSVDTKQSTNVTISYNHFWDSGKCNLQGMKSEETTNYITYHHNWYDHSDSRHPRIRTCSVHIYNNYFDGNAKYGVGVTTGASAFVENNYFRNCKHPMMSSLQGSDALADKGTFSGENGGIIKAFGNHIEGGSDCKVISYQENNTSFDAYVAATRDEKLTSAVKALTGGSTYNNFDTDSSIMYQYSVDSAEVAKTKVTTYAGRINGGDLKWTFDNATQDRNYEIIPELSDAVLNYKSSLVRVLGI